MNLIDTNISSTGWSNCTSISNAFPNVYTTREYVINIDNDEQKKHEKEEKKTRAPFVTIDRVIFDEKNRATVVFWKTNGYCSRYKTVVVCKKEDTYDPEKGLAIAFSKILFGNDTVRFHHLFREWLPETDVEQKK